MAINFTPVRFSIYLIKKTLEIDGGKQYANEILQRARYVFYSAILREFAR